MLYRCQTCGEEFTEPGCRSEVPDCNVPGCPSVSYSCCPKCHDDEIEKLERDEVIRTLKWLAEQLVEEDRKHRKYYANVALNAAAFIEWEA